MAIDRSRELARLANVYKLDGSPASSRLLLELAKFTNVAKSRIINPVLVNDAWTGSDIRKTVTTSDALFAMYPAVPLPPGTVRVDARLRVVVLSAGGEQATWKLALRPALYRGTIAPAATGAVVTSSTTLGYVSISIADLAPLAVRGPWLNDCYVSLHASSSPSGGQFQVTNLTVWAYGRDGVTA